MDIEYLTLRQLKPYEKNPRKNKNRIDPVARSIKEFGFKQPIVIDKDNVIIAGHTRFLAAKKLGMERVPCIRAEDLTDEQVRAYRLADNKTAEFAEWDTDLLTEELLRITDIDMHVFGFDADTYSDDYFTTEAAEPEDEEQEKLAVEKLPESRIGGFFISAFGTQSERFVEVLLTADQREKLLREIKAGGAMAIAERIKEAALDNAAI